MIDAIDLEHLADQLERVLAEQDRIRAEIGGLRDDIDGLRHSVAMLIEKDQPAIRLPQLSIGLEVRSCPSPQHSPGTWGMWSGVAGKKFSRGL
jgi:hypothetical protein